ncbi:hypothetical protein A3K72_00525 [Candidatus Woesearchaeota archaeon RBG_13_36_6]|nr:MAG: hypothetical protein A3K72_00525 [Candidatus Woesearchaeota archaeon RBG_13_36_6]
MKEEIQDIVDDNDNVIDKKTRAEVFEKNLQTRGTMIMVSNSKGDILVHKRTMNKEISPGLYSLFLGGGAISGEGYEECARREIEEEVGIRAKPEFMFKFKAMIGKLPAFLGVFKVVYDGKIKINKEEIEEAFFIKEVKLRDFMKSHKFSSDSIMGYKLYLETIMREEK